MKLYVIINNKDNKVIAISEDKALAYKYILQKNLNSSFRVITLKNKKQIETISLVYDELMLDIIDEFILTYNERKVINNIIEEEKSNIEEVISSLIVFLKKYDFNDKEYTHIKKTIKILSKNIKPKRILSLLKIRDFILNIINPKSQYIIDYFTEEIEKENNRMYIFIDIDD